MAQSSTTTTRPSDEAPRTPAPPIKIAVFATDFSPASLGAANAAAFVRDALGAKIIAMTALDPIAESSPHVEQNVRDWRSRVEQDARAYLETHGLADAEFEIAEGDSATQILQVVKKHKADLVIVGRRGSHAEAQVVLGNTTRRLVRKSPVSVLVARRDFDGKVQRIGVSTDFSVGADLALRRADAIATALRLPAVEILHSVEETPGAYAALSKQDFLKERRAAAEGHVERHAAAMRRDGGPMLRLEIGEGHASTAITDLSASLRLDLLFMGSHGSGRSALLLGSTAEHVLNLTPCSIWLEKSRENQRCLIERLAALIE